MSRSWLSRFRGVFRIGEPPMTGPSSAQMIPGTSPGTLQHRLRVYGPSGRAYWRDRYLKEIRPRAK